MNTIINNQDELIAMLIESPPDMTHVFILKGEEVYAYTCNIPNKTEELECFNIPEKQYGFWREQCVWMNVLCAIMDKHYPLMPFSGSDIDREMIRMQIQELLEGKLTEKQIRDLLGITNELNAQREEAKDLTWEKLLEKVRKGESL